jgi:hypothetical protein
MRTTGRRQEGSRWRLCRFFHIISVDITIGVTQMVSLTRFVDVLLAQDLKASLQGDERQSLGRLAAKANIELLRNALRAYPSREDLAA